jgi:Sulfotransferase domain
MTKFQDQRFLIIGGTSKAGTTSVFNYLASHPEICSFIKETRFFLDTNYPLPSEKRYEKNGPEAYQSFFDLADCRPNENWRLEATPDYLYSPNTPAAIRETLANVRLIFILREPISRLLSWYRFGQSVNEISSDITFDCYVDLQKRLGDTLPPEYRHPAFAALRHGHYSGYLRRFFNVFDKSEIEVFFYEDLRRDPLSFMISMCRSIGIDEAYFRDYSFNVLNKGVQVRNPRLHRAYFETKDKLRDSLRNAPRLRWMFRQLKRSVDFAYTCVNVARKEDTLMSSTTRDFLFSYYADEAGQLRDLVGIDVPWGKAERKAFV